MAIWWTITLEKASFLERPFEEEELLLFGVWSMYIDKEL
jgi:hypothetical protein